MKKKKKFIMIILKFNFKSWINLDESL
jgi:hypothetical protein